MAATKDIRQAVRAELDFDPLIDPANITVKNLSGDVALNGTVRSYPQYVEAQSQRAQAMQCGHCSKDV